MELDGAAEESSNPADLADLALNNGLDLEPGAVLDSMMLLGGTGELITFFENQMNDVANQFPMADRTDLDTATLTFHSSENNNSNNNRPSTGLLSMPDLNGEAQVSLSSLHSNNSEYHELQSANPSQVPSPFLSNPSDFQAFAPQFHSDCSQVQPSSVQLESLSNPFVNSGRVNESESNEELDKAFQHVFEVLASKKQKEIMSLLDRETLERCLSDSANHPILICHKCLDVFSFISPFQAHIAVCCGPSLYDVRSRIDQAAMELLAMNLWKQVFLKMLRQYPTGDFFKRHEGEVHKELEIVWSQKDTLDQMLKCRENFLQASLTIVTRKFVKTAIANELHRVTTGERNRARKRSSRSANNKNEAKSPPGATCPTVPVLDPATTPESGPSSSSPPTDAPPPSISTQESVNEGDVPPKRRRRSSRSKTKSRSDSGYIDFLEELELIENRDMMEDERVTTRSTTKSKRKPGRPNKKVSETDRAIKSLIASDRVFCDGLTPRSELSNVPEFELDPVDPSTQLTPMETAELPPNCSVGLTPETSETSDRGIDLTHDIDLEDMNIEELEKLEDADACDAADRCDSGIEGPFTIKTEPKSEDADPNGVGLSCEQEEDFVVQEILDRRPVSGKTGSRTQTDYEYLVRWEGFGEDEDTWEPFEHLQNCPIKMKQFHERLKKKPRKTK